MTSSSPTRRRVRLSRPVLIALGVLALVVAGLVAWQLRPKAPKDPYRTAAVEQGDITKSVSASGSLQALITVDVGSQISGQISKVLVDFNDQVHRGEVLATIDPQTFESRVAQGQADIKAGEAAVAQAQATLANAKADYQRKKALVDKGWYSPSTLDRATATWRNAEAGLAAARARVVQSRATLRSSQVDLSRTNIVAPIDGVIVDRKIQPGNTVAASLQAPVLFTIAEDLSKLQVKISVDEADVGQVREGQTVRFTVDAFPDDTYEGVVTQVRKQPTTDQNVVAYTVIAEADNPQGKLLPGMTANADIVLETRRGVLKVPVAALRWTPNGTVSPTRTPSMMGPGGFGGPSFGGPGGGFRSGGQGQRQGQGQGQQGQNGQGGRANALAALPDQLGLDAAQRKQWTAIEADLRAKMMAAFASAGGDRSQVREQMRKVREDAFARLDPILRPDQKQKLAALRAQLAQGRNRGGATRGGTVYVLREGAPVAIPVQVGATDGTNTEVSGPIKAGDQVIVGGGPKAKVKANAPFGGGGQGSQGGSARIRM
ncbi:efflux RND transporter periplasmic adaptor subunit [Phenylobacterium soli]|uniref:Efflux RND transporter periplasmic adaptor subunit n=1 Tax=Phenylobacterium soli TaxID=2170551 RepID=A0A328AKV1_9CAUL|nr:efflux RND transporter periplasmic adaptor subunit [Phenylobacterium soli]RAK55532.1 efflux RND transporter periplasmic adaptor subunit [Phenylobacterium soli]